MPVLKNGSDSVVDFGFNVIDAAGYSTHLSFLSDFSVSHEQNIDSLYGDPGYTGSL